jgi:hypothetical protein
MRTRFSCALLLLLAAACGGEVASDAPVATPSVSLSRPRASLGSPIEITYRFDVLPGAQFGMDYTVLSHFVDADGQFMWTDDHQPPRPTSTWKPGEKVEYTRTMFVPVYPYIGQATIRVGLYSPKAEGRLALNAEGTKQREYPVATLELLPQSENVFIHHKEGWHQVEVAPENPAVEWYWTKKTATLAFRNPRKDVLFYLQLDARPDLAGSPQQVSVRSGDQVVASFTVASQEQVLQKIPLSAAQLGSADMAELTIDVDKTFVPATLPGGSKADNRELGVRVFHAFIEPRG